MPRTIKDLSAALLRKTGWSLLWALALMSLFSLSEGAGLMLLLPILQIAGFGLQNQGRVGHFERAIASALARYGIHPTLASLVVVFVAIIAGRAFLGSEERVQVQTVRQRFTASLRCELYRAVTSAEWLFICHKRASSFAHGLTAEVDRVGDMAELLMAFASDALLTGLYVGLAMAVSTPVTLLVLLCGATIFYQLRRHLGAIRESGERMSRRTNSLYAAINDQFQNLKVSRVYHRQATDVARFENLAADLASTMIQCERHGTAMSFWFEVGSALVLGGVVYGAIGMLGLRGAEIAVLLFLSARTMPRLMRLAHLYQGVTGLAPSYQNLTILLQECLAHAEPVCETSAALRLTREVRLENVCFSYIPGTRAQISNANLVIPAGGITAIVGPSGAGKSTIADLVIGLLQPTSGTITVDGIPLGVSSMAAWRKRIGYVGQDSFLFHDTVRANLIWANPAADENAIRRALRISAALDFVDRLPAGLDTVIGDRGATLSHGERRRLAVARAILRSPALLILDEPTSGLDSENEARILDELKQLRGETTVLLISHRLSAIRFADVVYVLDNGKVLESGHWSELVQIIDGRFRALHRGNVAVQRALA